MDRGHGVRATLGPRLRPTAVRTGPAEGQALVEFSIVIILLVLILLAVVDFGRMLAIHAAVVTASREAARYATAVGADASGDAQYLDCPGIRQAARTVAGSLASLTDADIVITYDNGTGGSTGAIACTSDASRPAESDIDPFDRVIVQVTGRYAPITPLRAIMGQTTVVSIDRRAIAKP